MPISPSSVSEFLAGRPHSSIGLRIASGVSWAFCGRFVAAGTGLVITALLARLLNPQELGAYFLTVSVVSVAAIIAQLGLTQIIVRLIAEEIAVGAPGRARSVLFSSFRIGTVGALLVAALFVVGPGPWIAKEVFDSPLMADTISLAAAWLVFFSLHGLLVATFRGFHDIRLASLFERMILNIISLILFTGLWLLRGDSDLRQVLILFIFATAATVLFAGFLVRKKAGALENNQPPMPTFTMLSMAWPVLITNVTRFALTQADLWVLAGFRTQNSVALYGAALRLVALVAIPLMLVNAVLPPLIAEMSAQGKKKELESWLRRTATITALPAIFVLIAFILFGEFILGAVYGDFYSAAALVLTILSAGRLVNVWSGSCGLTLMMTGHQRTLMTITIICGIATVIAASWSVRSYGATGVAIAASGGLVLQNLLMLIYTKRKTGIWTHLNINLLSPKKWLTRFQDTRKPS